MSEQAVVPGLPPVRGTLTLQPRHLPLVCMTRSPAAVALGPSQVPIPLRVARVSPCSLCCCRLRPSVAALPLSDSNRRFTQEDYEAPQVRTTQSRPQRRIGRSACGGQGIRANTGSNGSATRTLAQAGRVSICTRHPEPTVKTPLDACIISVESPWSSPANAPASRPTLYGMRGYSWSGWDAGIIVGVRPLHSGLARSSQVREELRAPR